ncbi:hypothetical protein SAMN04487888_1213 [Eubacterium callanderi]|uniref:hypothetical protein n=1 Tax=Eubacterium callanderi TaxID=53442 RepID=UPI0008EF412F|nr:hypothetical protein [Eubacterium callanderi]SFP71141.1 hypothetical protein SAMN04487888_1213 [Eubacterium callanderi]
MNYIAELNAFDRWLETNYLPALSELLWRKMVALFNRCGWAEWISVDNQRLMGLIQVKREATFIDYRNKLVEAGLIEYQKGKKGSPNRYKLISLSEGKNNNTFTSEVQTEVNTEAQSVVNPVVNTVVKTVDINKLNQTKRNKIKDMPGTKRSEPVAMLPLKDGTEYEISAESFEEFVSAYPEINVLSEMRKMRAWCLSNPANRKTRRGIMKFINGWLGRAKPESQNPGSGPSYDYTGDETI